MIDFIADPIFPGGGTLPVLSTGKVIYEVAAFLPKSNKLDELAEVGKLWVCFFICSLKKKFFVYL